jgi:hypothetical protein
MVKRNILCVILDLNLQTERFLSGISNNESVYILTPKSLEITVKDCYSRKLNIESIFTYETENGFNINIHDKKLLNTVKNLKIDKTIIPFPVTRHSLEFIQNSSVPSISNFYLLSFFSNKCGIKRDVEINDLKSVVTIRVPSFLTEYIDKHYNKRAFIVGNGPSLSKIDMTLLKDEITFGSNRCYLGFEKWGFSFNYWAVVDRLQIEGHISEWEDKIPKETIKFFPFEYLPLFNFKESYVPINFLYKYKDHVRSPRFDKDPHNTYLGYTTTHTLLQLAVVMGCNPIYLVGVDHDYNSVDKSQFTLKINSFISRVLSKILKGNSHQFWTSSDSKSQTHFDPRYNDPEQGRKFILPNPHNAEKAFEGANNWMKSNGVEIYNATPNSKLNAFKKIDFSKITFK